MRAAIAQHAGLPEANVAISKPFRSLLSQLSTVLEAIQSVNWDVDLQCIAAKSPWYLACGELIMYKDTRDPEKHAEFVESLYTTAHAPGASRAEPVLRIRTKFDQDFEGTSREGSTPPSPAAEPVVDDKK